MAATASSSFPVHELHTQAGFPLREGRDGMKGNNSSYHAFVVYGFLNSFLFLPSWHTSLGAKPTADTHSVSSDTPLIAACHWEHRCGGI